MKTVPHRHIAHIRSSKAAPGVQEYDSLEEHLKRVADMAQGFARKADIPLAGYLAGLVHDFGKYSAKFQSYILSAHGCISWESSDYVDPVKCKGKIDHSTAGAQRLWHFFARNPKCIPMARMLAMCVFSHHSGLLDCISPEGEDVFGVRIGKDDAKSHLQECLAQCDPSIIETIQSFLQPAVMTETHAALVRLNTRIKGRLPTGATDDDICDNENSRDFQQGLLIRFLLSCLLDADRIDSAEFDDRIWKEQRARLPRRPWDRLVARLEKCFADKKPEHAIDNLRRDVSGQCLQRAGDDKGLFTLTVPTGGGKTLASLRFALNHAHRHNMDRVLYVIPYTSIIDQNADVARGILEQDEAPGSIVLEHHSNLIPAEGDFDAEGSAKQWEKLAENWEAPVVFTTMVQFLESIFGSGTRHARRMHNLANSVLVFDEIQTLPVRCLRMFCNAIDFLIHSCGSSALLCTATQPRLGHVPRPQLGSLPLTPEREIIRNVPELFASLRRTAFIDHCDRDMSADEVAKLAMEELRATGSCLVICNTKRLAEKIYTRTAGQVEGCRYYLSTNLCPAHRLERLEAMRAELKDHKPILCVSTQLVECGVDISFGSVIRFAAGLDSILQAAGRCNRHGGPVLGRVHVVKARDKDEYLDMLTDIKEGRAIFLDSVRVGLAGILKSSGYDLTHPEIIATYFEHYFYRRGSVMSYPLKRKRGETLLNMLGSNSKVTEREELISKQSFASAAQLFHPIDTPTEGIIVPHGDGESIIADLCSTDLFHRKKELLRKAQRYSVNIFPHDMKKLQSQHALHNIQNSGIFALNARYYCPESGVVTEPRAGLDSKIL